MSNIVLLFIIIVAVVGGALFKFHRPIMMLVRIFSREDYEKNPSGTVLSRTDAQAVSMGLVICEQNMFFSDSLEAGGRPIDIKEQQDRLANQWDVVSRESALDAMERFRKGGRRALEDFVLEVFLKVDEAGRSAVLGEHLPEALQQDARELLAQLPNLIKVLKEKELYREDELPGILERGTLAWDLGRVVYLARASLQQGYLDESTAWAVVRESHAQMGDHFPSWRAFAQSYMLGRAIWSVDDMGFDGLADIAKSAQVDENSPWVLFPLG